MRVPVPRAGGGVSRSLLLCSSDEGGGVRELRALDKELRRVVVRHGTGDDVLRSAPPAYMGGIGNSRFSPARVIVMLARAGMMVSEEEVDVVDVVDVTDILDTLDPADMVDAADVVDPPDMIDIVEVADPTDEVDVLDDAVEGGW